MDEIKNVSRYARHFSLGVIGRAGQQKLSLSTVLIIGCGGLGSTQAELLARAGIGKLIIVDRDTPALDNLPRQLLYDERDVHERIPKAAAAARRLNAINSELIIQAVVTDVTARNIEELIQTADLALDGTDNVETRYLLNDAAVRSSKPWIYGGVLGTAGTVMVVRPGVGPCLRCVFEYPLDPARFPSCEIHGVLNTAVAWVAALQVTEALKLLVGVTDAEFRLHSLDIWSGSVGSITVGRKENCICCGQRRFEFLEVNNS